MKDPYPSARSTINNALLELSQLVRDFEAAGPGQQADLQQRINERIGRLRDDTRALKLSLDNVEALRALSLPIEEIQNRHGFVDDAKDRLLYAEKKFFRAVREKSVEEPQRVSLQDALRESKEPNEFLRGEIGRQQAMRAQQEADIDMIHKSVKRVKKTADDIAVSLVEDEAAREGLDSRINRLTGRLQRANKRVDRLLVEASKGQKLGAIAILMVILIILVVLTFVI